MTNVTDIEDVVKTWAWTSFCKTRSKDLQKLKYDDVHLDVNWTRVRFIPGDPDYSDKEMVESPKSKVVFTSSFENNTDTEQEHSFTTERTTVCTCTTLVSKGYTKGFHLELKLGLPEEVCSATAGFGREVNMESAEENTQEETISWAVNSNVKVPRKHRTTAKMVVKEMLFSANFKLSVKIKGTVVVVITNIKDNNSFIQSVEGDISQILQEEAKRGKTGYIIEDRAVTWVVEGSTKFRFGVEQFVKLNEEPLE
ncbi:hypothetical protein CHS0354_030453 [Potamilus streckersoni]|uniref:Uncharacterized protein n=1 Tax=Potamilus streckersoni TaxID=2493646 RepID=A0AAE0T2C5_9BIVA|nr:hypothetical protein CHS0354_030453 [Potamilus streckersoni]